MYSHIHRTPELFILQTKDERRRQRREKGRRKRKRGKQRRSGGKEEVEGRKTGRKNERNGIPGHFYSAFPTIRHMLVK